MQPDSHIFSSHAGIENPARTELGELRQTELAPLLSRETRETSGRNEPGVVMQCKVALEASVARAYNYLFRPLNCSKMINQITGK